jgi:hypothetical protein
MYKKRILWITQTAIFIALLVSAQAITRPLGQFVTGSCVNFILVSSCILAGLSSAAIVAIVSPLFAFIIIGIPAFPLLIPFMMAGNFVLVAAIYLISGKSLDNLNRRAYVRVYASAVVGAILKFLVLWVGIVQIALSFIPNIRQPQIDAMSAAFSWPQLVTALIGSSLAIAVMPSLKKALKLAERG